MNVVAGGQFVQQCLAVLVFVFLIVYFVQSF